MRDPLTAFRSWLCPTPANAPSRPDAFIAPPAHTGRNEPWLDQLDRAGLPRSLNYPATTLGRLVDQAADRFPDHIAIFYAHRDWTYRHLAAWINRVAGGLAALGVGPGDRVLLALPNCPEFVAIFFAIQKLAAVPVNAGPLLGHDDLQHLIHLTTPRVVIGLDLHAAHLAGAAVDSSVEHFVHVSLEGYQDVLHWTGYQFKLWQRPARSIGRADEITLDALIESAPPRPPTTLPDPHDIALLQPTSGTTGLLKLSQLSHRNLLANATQISVCTAARAAQERTLAVIPMFHAYGLMLGVIAPILGAASIAIQTRFDAADCLDAVLRHRLTVLPLVPAICHALSNEIQRRGKPIDLTSHLRICLSGAAPLPQHVAERFCRLTGVVVIEGYGLTEAGPVTHANLMGQPRYGSIGLPLPDTSIRVADLLDASRDAASGQPGELLVSGPQIMSGYFASPRDTAAIFFDDPAGRRWLRTGDIVTVDPDGFFRVVDRKKDMINRAGFKVYPAKCEHILAMHPQVVEAAVVGIAASSNGDEPESTSSDADAHDNTRGEQVVAVIVARSHDINRTTLMTELQALCREHLAVYEVPTRFVFLDQLPKSVLGKVLKKDLRVTLASTPVSHAESPVPHNGDSKAAPVGRPTSSVPISPIPRGPAVAR